MGTNCKRATRPCPCGYLGHFSGRCRCSPDVVARHRLRISGPLLDRIDLHVEVPALREGDLAGAARGEASAAVRERVARARQCQVRRQGVPNGRLAGTQIETRAQPDAKAARMLREASARLGLSARAHHRVLKVARTVADLEGRERVDEDHVAEALTWRLHPKTA